MKVYVVRHGESENNLKGLWTGWYNAPLTEKGILDAKKAGELLRGISFDKVYSSDLDRAVETGKNAIPGREIITTAKLREINVGNIANKPLGSISDEEKRQCAKEGYAIFDGESKAEFKNRVGGFLKELELCGSECVAVFSHAGFLRTVLDVVVGIDLPRKNIACNNCTVGVFEFSGTEWRMLSWINI